MSKVLTIPVWIDTFYRPKLFKEFYRHMDAMYNFADRSLEERLDELRGKLVKGDVGDEDAAEFLTFLISRDDINFEEIKINLLEILMASIETVWLSKKWTTKYE